MQGDCAQKAILFLNVFWKEEEWAPGLCLGNGGRKARLHARGKLLVFREEAHASPAPPDHGIKWGGYITQDWSSPPGS